MAAQLHESQQAAEGQAAWTKKAVQRPMPRPNLNKRPLYARLTKAEIATLKEVRDQQHAATLSVVLEEALRDLLSNPGLERDGLRLPVVTTRIIPRTYQMSQSTLDLVDQATSKFGYSMRDLLRAAVGQLGSVKKACFWIIVLAAAQV